MYAKFLSTIALFLFTSSAEAAVKFKEDLTLLSAEVDTELNLPLRSLLSDTGSGNPLKWSVIGPGKPAWLTVDSPNERMTGKPVFSDVGMTEFRLAVQDGDAGAITLVRMTVLAPPKWTESPLNLGEQKEDSFWGFDLKTKISNPLGGNLTFSATNLPAWMSLTPTGLLSGTPRRPHVGDYSGIKFTATNAHGSKTVDAFGKVLKTIHPPFWKENPINAENAFEDSAYSFALAPFVDNFEQAPLTYTIVVGPPWINITTNEGTISGTPFKPDLGPVNMQVKLSADIDGQHFESIVTVKFTVIHVNHPPTWTQNPISLPNAPERSLYNQSVKSFATDIDDGDVLSFEKVSGPAWASVTATGSITGTPGRPDVGPNELIVRVKDQTGASADVTVKITVDYVNQKPIWSQSPVVLPNGPERVLYSQELSKFASDPDAGDTISFSKISGPAWASIEGDGTIAGTPGRVDVGLNSFVVRVSDQKGATADVTVQMTVEYVNQPPVWTQDPIVLPNAPERSPYSQSVSSFASDPDTGDTLSFAKVSGPAWANVAANGTIAGTPQRADVGLNTFVLRVSDQKGLSANVTVQITVDYVNQKPVWTQSPINLPDAPERVLYTQELASFATDPDSGDTLSFSKVSGPAWASIEADGTITGTPQRADVGANSFTVRVSDQKGLTADATVNIKVLYVNQPPVWSENPITLPNAPERSPYSQAIASFASDPDAGDTLTFSKVSGPAWANIAANGRITGTPQRADVGLNTFVMKVQDQKGLSSEVTVLITVDYVNNPPLWTQNPIRLPNALTWSPYSKSLKEFVIDPDTGDTLSFAKVSGPAWASIASDGTVSGTPDRPDIGENELMVSVTDGKATAQVKVLIKVIKANEPPVWLANPTLLKSAQEDFLYSQILTSFVSDPDNDPVTFRILSGPAWATITTGATITGIPGKSELGLNVFTIEVTDGISGTSTADVHITVLHTNHPPFWTHDPIRLPNAREREAYSQTLAPFAKENDSGDTLTFEKVSGPAWASVGLDGTIFGTPQRPDVGENSFQVKVIDQGGLSAVVTVQIKVEYVNQAPLWTQNPVVLPNAFERSLYSESVVAFAQDPDGDALTFEKISGPAWASFSNTGAVTGTPQREDLGLNLFKVKITDPSGLFAETDVHITVEYVNHPPEWTQNPILLADAFEDSAYSFDIAPLVTDKDGEALTFTLIQGPDWLSVAADGKLSGTPSKPHIGNYEATFEVTDGKSKVRVIGKGRVIHVNHPPFWTQNPIQMPNAKERSAYNESIAQYADDIDTGDVLSFTKVSGPDWLSVTNAGAVVGTPQRPDVGINTFKVRVTDLAGEWREVDAIVEVEYVNNPPRWTLNPLVLPDAPEETPYQTNVAVFAFDADNEPLTFTKVNGPEWLQVAADGTLSGTPAHSDLGDYQATLRVSDGKASADVAAIGKVTPINHPPKITQDNIAYTVKERTVKTDNLKKFVEDIDGDVVTFQLVDVVDFVSLSPTGDLRIAPVRKDVGVHTVRFMVHDGSLQAQANLIITVTKDPRPPVWLEDPIRFQTKALENFAKNIADKAQDLDGSLLTFSKVSGPSWMSVAGDGSLSGVPQNSDIGENTFVVRITNEEGLGANATVIVKVTPDNYPPEWTQDPILLADAHEDRAYAFDIAPLVTDPDGDTLTFAKIAGPAWLQVASDGKLSGTPAKADIGSYEATFEVNDGKAKVQVKGLGKVLPVNHPPTVNQDNLVFTVKARETLSVDLTDPQYITDLDGDALSFALLSGADFITLSPSGLTVLTPQNKDVGDYEFPFTVKDKEFTVNAKLIVQVIKNPRPPIWAENPIRFTAKVDEPFTQTLADKVTDPDGQSITFSTVSGPAWLTVASNGGLSGTPLKADLGTNLFVVTASNPDMGANVDVIIEVTEGGDQTDRIVVDEAVPGAASEHLWVIDKSYNSQSVIKALYKDYHIFYDMLDEAQIHYQGLLISADPKTHKGIPIASGDRLISWNEADVLGGFKARLDKLCWGNCWHSPIWSMKLFHDWLPTAPEYEKEYFVKDVPMDALILTQQQEQYPAFSKGTPYQSWISTDYARYFKSKHDEKGKPYRISTIAPECLVDATAEKMIRPNNAYQKLVDETKGKYYVIPQCPNTIASELKDFAEKVIFRAYVSAKQEIKLTKTPDPAFPITVTLGGTSLASTLWAYNPTTNTIHIHWHQIDFSTINPGSILEIKYRY